MILPLLSNTVLIDELDKANQAKKREDFVCEKEAVSIEMVLVVQGPTLFLLAGKR